MLNDYQILANDIAKLSEGRKIIYIPNPGNWGDGLIRHGTKLFLEDFNIEHTEVRISHRWGKVTLLPYLAPGLMDQHFFLFGGGGAWCHAYPGSMKMVRYMLRFTDKVLVLPSTYELAVPFRSGTYYSRGRKESMTALPSAKFCHDMALYIDVRKSRERRQSLATHRLGIFMRQDRESALNHHFPAETMDISALGNEMSCGETFIARLGLYENIFTDRLHVAVGGSIAGSRVHLLSGNYFKIREIYEASLKNRFSELVFHSDAAQFYSAIEKIGYLGSAR